MMTQWLFSLVFTVIDVAAILLLVGTWQHTRITGFLLLATSYLFGMVARWVTPLLYRFADGDFGMVGWIFPLVQSVYALIAAIAVFGLWDIYRSLKRNAAGGR